MGARARAERGLQALDSLQAAFGAHIFDTPPPTGVASEEENRDRRGTRDFVEPILRDAGLPTDLAEALDDESWDGEIAVDGDEALLFFGPVISRLPEEGRLASCGTTWWAWRGSPGSP